MEADEEYDIQMVVDENGREKNVTQKKVVWFILMKNRCYAKDIKITEIFLEI